MTDYLEKHDKFKMKHCNELSVKDKLRTGYRNQKQLERGLALYKSPRYQMQAIASIPESATKLADRIFVDHQRDDPHERNILRAINTEKEPERNPNPLIQLLYTEEEGMDSPRASVADADEFLVLEPTPPPAPSPVVRSRGGARRGAGRPSQEQRDASDEYNLPVRDIREIDTTLRELITELEEE